MLFETQHTNTLTREREREREREIDREREFNRARFFLSFFVCFVVVVGKRALWFVAFVPSVYINEFIYSLLFSAQKRRLLCALLTEIIYTERERRRRKRSRADIK